MSPEEARRLLDGTTPGPWKWRWDTGTLAVFDVEEEPVAIDLDVGDSDLIAAAPVLAAMIAGMSPEYRAEYQAAGGRWFPVPHYCSCGRGWGTKQRAERIAADWKDDGYTTRVVHRYVTEPGEA